MKMTVYAGWLNLVLGVVLGIGGFVAGMPLLGVILLVSLSGSGWFMIWLASGWDKPLDNAAELYKYGRPANATVESIDEAALAGDGTRTARVKLHVEPINEPDYRTTRTLALPGGRVPAVGERVTVKFDPQSKKNVVLLEETYEVENPLAQARRDMQALTGSMTKAN